MSHVLFAMLTGVLGQLGEAPPMPELEKPTVQIRLESGRTLFASEFEVSGTSSNPIVRFREDDPGPAKDGLETVRKDEIVNFPPPEERPSQREERWARRYEELGFKKTETNGGETVWLPAREVTLAERARAMETELRQQMTDPGDAPEAGAGADATPLVENGNPSFLSLWGAHLAITAGAIAIVGLVLKAFVFSNE